MGRQWAYVNWTNTKGPVKLGLVSEVPPPFTPSAPPYQRKDRTVMIVILILVGLLLACGCGVIAIGYFGWGAMKKIAGPIAGCAINFEATRDGILEYARAHDGRLPNAETWQEDVKDYVKRHLDRAKEVQDVLDAKLMNTENEWGCYLTSTRTTGIAFNSDLSGKLLTDVKDPFSTPLVFEIEKPRKNAAEKYTPLPESRSPTIMGEPRGGIWMPVDGEMKGMTEGGNWNMRSSTGNRGEVSADPGEK